MGRFNFLGCSHFALFAIVIMISCSDEQSSTLSSLESLDVGEDILSDAADSGWSEDECPPDLVDENGDPEIEWGQELDVAEDQADAESAEQGEEEVYVPPEGPPTILFTINELPEHLNGSMPYLNGAEGPFDFSLRLPTHGFTLDLLADRPASWLDRESFRVACDQPIGEEAEIESGRDLAPHFEWSERRIRWLVPAEYAFESSPVSCRARVGNLEGELSEWSEVVFDTMYQGSEYHPFDPPDVWVVTFHRDYHTIWFELDGMGNFAVHSEREPNGIPDLREDLAIIGLRGQETGEGAKRLEARGVVGVNAVVEEWLITESMRQTRLMFGLDPDTGRWEDEDAVRLTLYREGEPGAPNADSWDRIFSIHGVGGDAPPEWPTLFGRATAIDYNNRTAQDDSVLGYGSFTTNMIRQIVEHPAGRFMLREFLPEWGVPIGEADEDAHILSADFDYQAADFATRRRYDQLNLIMTLFAKGLSSLIAHEMGHSLGLVPPGPPPSGLFGGIYDPRWMASQSDNTHIDTFGLNVMQSGGSLMSSPANIVEDPISFYPLNLAYLRGRVIVLR